MEDSIKRSSKEFVMVDKAEGTGWSPVCKSTNRNRVQCPKPAEQGEYFINGTCSLIPNHGSEEHHPSKKIKLQLFPINDRISSGLEKDGFNPYLELTLSARKKISSVLKRINSKWGPSSAAVGEPFLFPYYSSEGLVGQRWMMNDTVISAGDVYKATGSPPIFRLRYGWSSDAEAKTSEVQPTLASSESCLQLESIEQCDTGCMGRMHDKRREIEETREELVPLVKNETAAENVSDKASPNDLEECSVHNARTDGGTAKLSVPWDDSVSNISIGGLLSEASLQGRLKGCNQGRDAGTDGGAAKLSVPWDDSITNISIGGLLSEASLQGRLNSSDSKSNGVNTFLQPSQLAPDSFDAFIAAQLSYSQGPRPIPPGSVSSILDAEDTCHAFSFPKIASPRKNPLPLNGSSLKTVDVYFKSMNQKAEINVQSVVQQEDLGPLDSQTYPLPVSRAWNEESTLDLSGIKWAC